MKMTVSASHFLILRIDYMVTKCLSGSHMEKTYLLSQRADFSLQYRFIAVSEQVYELCDVSYYRCRRTVEGTIYYTTSVRSHDHGACFLTPLLRLYSYDLPRPVCAILVLSFHFFDHLLSCLISCLIDCLLSCLRFAACASCLCALR